MFNDLSFTARWCLIGKKILNLPFGIPEQRAFQYLKHMPLIFAERNATDICYGQTQTDTREWKVYTVSFGAWL